MFWVLAKFHKGMAFMEVVLKNEILDHWFFLPWLPRMSFPYETWQALKTLLKVCHQFIFRIFRIFLNFTVHAKIIWAKTKMGTGQHFFLDCKLHAHIGDAFLNILISCLNFSELVWIFYEVFKVMVKRSKGKSIRGAKWFGQEQVFSETRGKPAEWDTTKGTKLIIPNKKDI